MKQLLQGVVACLWLAAAGGAVAQAPARAVCNTCGVVEAVRYMQVKGEASGLGAVAGGVVGGVLGHQVGSGRGNTVATIAGAGAGAYAGHQVEKNVKKKSYYEIAVRLDNGKRRTLTQDVQPRFHDGDRVRIVNGSQLVALAR